MPAATTREAEPWRRRIRWRLELLGWQTLAAFLWQLGHRRALRFGEAVGRLLPWVSPRRLQVATHDLRRVFGTSKTEAEIDAIARQCLATLGGTLAELLWLRRAARADVEALVELDDGARMALAEAAAHGRGVILTGIHFGRWELMFLGLNLSGQRFTLVARPLANPYLDAYLAGIRCRFGNSLVHIGKARPLHQVLAAGDMLVIAMDHHSERRHAAVVDFLGQTTSLTTGVARLALHYGATVLPIHPLPLAGGRLRIEIGPALETSSSGDRRHDVIQLTQRAADVLGAVIAQYPQYWMWSHRRLWRGG